MQPDFLHRTFPIIGREGYEILSNSTIAIAGLGGVGGLAFLTLVRSGIKKFKITDGGLFDPPDMNRQALAYGKTMDRDKMWVYLEYAKDINPKIEVTTYEGGLKPGNAERFIDGADVFIRAMDYGRDSLAKEIATDSAYNKGIPMIQGLTAGMASVLHCYKKGGMTSHGFWNILKNRRDLSIKYMYGEEIADRCNEAWECDGTNPSSAIGANMASIMVASETLLYLLRNTQIVDRPVIYAPNFVVFNPFKMEMNILDITEL